MYTSISDFRFQISDFRFQISDFRFQISGCRFQNKGLFPKCILHFQISDFRIQISDLWPAVSVYTPISAFSFQISDFRFQSHGLLPECALQFPISDYRFQIWESWFASGVLVTMIVSGSSQQIQRNGRVYTKTLSPVYNGAILRISQGAGRGPGFHSRPNLAYGIRQARSNESKRKVPVFQPMFIIPKSGYPNSEI